MTTLVVDASVAVKWFVPEPGTERALPLLDGSFDLLAPDLLLPEVGNILWKKVRRKEIAPRDARDILAALSHVPLSIVSSGSLLEGALEIALEYERSVYDALYVALAVARDCRLATGDNRLARSLAGGPLARHIAPLSGLS